MTLDKMSAAELHRYAEQLGIPMPPRTKMITKVPCLVCGAEIERTTDYIEHTLCESSETCPKCGYEAVFQYGYCYERIGEWGGEKFSDGRPWDEHSGDNVRAVALLVRRFQLGLLPPGEAGFGAALDLNPGDFTAAKVFADYLDERGRGAEAYMFRNYNDTWGFPL